jgi:UDP-N-acetylmuramoylalanine--D-glutamate ligase
MNHLRELSVLVLGLGASGLAMARWCASQGARVTVWDSRAEPPGWQALRDERLAVELIKGALTADALVSLQLVLKSPGLAPSDERIAGLLQAARAQGIAVQGELDLFVRALADLKAERGYAPQVVAVTGTNGKTTTTALAALLIERAGKRVVSAGNIGPTLLDTLAAALADQLPEVWVLELSSFQLDGVQGFDPDAAAVLNLSQDHLDWHGDMAAYAAAKARIWGPTTRIVSNRDDAQVEALIPQPVAVKGSRAAPKPRAVVRFGIGAPQAPGDFGLIA